MIKQTTYILTLLAASASAVAGPLTFLPDPTDPFTLKIVGQGVANGVIDPNPQVSGTRVVFGDPTLDPSGTDITYENSSLVAPSTSRSVATSTAPVKVTFGQTTTLEIGDNHVGDYGEHSTVVNQGTINTTSSAVINYNNGGNFINDSTGVINHQGTIVAANGGTVDLRAGSLITGSGDIDVSGQSALIVNGTINQSAGGSILLDASTLSGSGVINFNSIDSILEMNNGSVLIPGNSPGTLTINGNARFSNSTIQMEVGATASDKLVINGMLDLIDTDIVFEIMDDFSEEQFSALTLDDFFEVSGQTSSPTDLFGSTSFSLVSNQGVTNPISFGSDGSFIVAVSEPSTISLFLSMSAIFGFSQLSKRRRTENA